MKTFFAINCKFVLVLFIGLLAFQAQAQDPSSILDLESTTQGLLAPRMTTAERTAIVTPAQSLMVYDTDTKSFWYYKDAAWSELGAGASPWLAHANGIYYNGYAAIGGTPNNLQTLFVTDSTVNENIIHSIYTKVNGGDVRALRGTSVPQDGYGIGVEGTGGYRGVIGTANGGAYSGATIGGLFSGNGTAGTRYGVYAIASNSGGNTGYGIYSTASGATTNWAGYFGSGDVYITNDLRVGNTTGATGYKVSVDGKIACEEVLVDLNGDWPDYVFSDDYELKSLNEVKQHITQKGHLPGVPSALEIENNGIVLGEMNKVLMEKIEELTLYILQQEEKINAQNERINALESINK